MSVLQACPEPAEGFHFTHSAMCYGLLFCFPFSRAAVTTLQHNQSPSCIAEGPARFAWQPDLYQNWTFTSKQTMIYQDAPRFVGRLYGMSQIIDTFHQLLQATEANDESRDR